ncbi:hypothetical protein [uncultured Mailhella sp.]|uniref:hypothetical protein n=1 Tax=uncultured Mailhella sp. TaxID=1981031 RepID=UPI00320AECFD
MSNVDIFKHIEKIFFAGKNDRRGERRIKIVPEMATKKTKVFQPIVARIITI